jgi:D-alanyl-D-alanine endopeptidase (penicillin-binding protein 7)
MIKIKCLLTKRSIALFCLLLSVNSTFAIKSRHKVHKHHVRSSHKTRNILSESKVNPILISNNADIESVINDNVGPYLYSYSAVAYDVDQEKIIFSKHANTILPMASITKLMTGIIVLDSDVSMSQEVKISTDDIDSIRNSYSRLRVGQTFTRKNLLLMALMSSENRAASALGRTTFNSRAEFISKMNEKAASLGMTNTKFYDTTGLDQRNVSTPLDLLKLVKAAYQYKEIRNYSTTAGADILLGDYYHHYINSDSLVRGHNMEILLSKTGFINESGHHVVLYAKIKDHPVIIVLMDSASSRARAIDGIAIKHYLLNYFS